MRRLTKEELQTFRHEFEQGMPIAAIAKKYGVHYSTIFRWKRKGSWKHWVRQPQRKMVAEAKVTSRDFRKDDRSDVALIDTHLAEWRTIRRMLQEGVDRGDRARVDFVQSCATVIATIQDRERELRALRTKGRLKVVALRSPSADPKSPPRPGRFAPKIRRPENVRPTMASEVKTVEDLVKVWMPSDPPASATHRKYWLSHIDDFFAFVGHRDPRLVTRDDAFRWRDQLILSGMTARTVHNGRVAALRALFQYAVHADVVDANPFANVTFRYDPRPFQRRGYSSAEAKAILAASLESFERQLPYTRAIRRWVPWVCAFTGARAGEVIQLRKCDVQETDGIPFMVVDPDAGPVKGYVGRKVPLHPQLIEDGFLAFVSGRPEGHLFADETGTLHRFAAIGYLGRWIRKLGVNGKKTAPLHSFRHRFKSVARDAGIPLEYHQAITGHRVGRTRGDDYGEVPITALYREILKLPRIAIPHPKSLPETEDAKTG